MENTPTTTKPPTLKELSRRPVALPIENKPAAPGEERESADPGSWKEVGRWTFTGYKTTDRFQIRSSRWKISWSTLDTLGIDGYEAIDNRIVANIQSDDNGESFVHEGPGWYYLELNNVRDYSTVLVEEPN